MPWKRGAEQKPGQGKLSAFYAPLTIQSLNLIDIADPKKGSRIRCLGASDKINSGRIRIRASAWSFRTQGAPMLYEHGMDQRVGSLALGRWDKFEVKEGVGLIAEGTLDEFEQSDPRALIVADIKAKRITDVSVGHRPGKLKIAKDQGDEFLDIEQTTLGEISFCAVGMDADAQHEMMAASALGYEWDEQRAQPAQGGIMDRKLLIQMLNMSGAKLAEDANEAQILAAVQVMSASAAQSAKAVEALGILGLKPEASMESIKSAVQALKTPENFVSKAEFDKLEQSLAVSEIEKLIAEKKQIPNGQREFAKTLLLQGHKPESAGRKLFDTWVASLPAINVRQVTGAGAGAPPREEQEGGGMEITDEDRSWCQNLGYFRDERDKATGKVVITGVERMAQMAEVETSEALEWLFGQAIPMTDLDRMMSDARKAQNARP